MLQFAQIYVQLYYVISRQVHHRPWLRARLEWVGLRHISGEFELVLAVTRGAAPSRRLSNVILVHELRAGAHGQHY